MKINISTRVDKSYLEVKEGFTEKLFLKLNPPFPPVRLLRFDGSSKGDYVSLELNFFIFKQKWTSEIIADHTDENEFYFIDEGVELPFFLKKWQHKHRVIKRGSGSLIKDEIDYKGTFGLVTLLLFPVLYGQFLYRQPIYKKIFQLRSY
jgi:ligand-binding SRPBCC domain-containing protein